MCIVLAGGTSELITMYPSRTDHAMVSIANFYSLGVMRKYCDIVNALFMRQ